jgi:hypothetical protein
MTDEEIDKISYQNAMKWFNYDPFKHIPKEQSTVGALRAQAEDVDISLVSHDRGLHPSDYTKGYATIADLVGQMAQALTSLKVGR